MNKRIFVDSDVILDLLCNREPFYRDAAAIFTLADSGDLSLCTSSLVFSNIFYIIRKVSGAEKARLLLRKLSILVHILAVDEKIVELSLNSEFSDFEDGIQYFTSRENGVSILLTRNVKDYKVIDIIVQTPNEYLLTRHVSPS